MKKETKSISLSFLFLSFFLISLFSSFHSLSFSLPLSFFIISFTMAFFLSYSFSFSLCCFILSLSSSCLLVSFFLSSLSSVSFISFFLFSFCLFFCVVSAPLEPPVYPLPLHNLYVNHRLYNPFKLLNVIGWDACLDLPTPHSRLEAFRHEFNLKSFYLLPLDDRVSLKANIQFKPPPPSSLSSSLSSLSSLSSSLCFSSSIEGEEEKKRGGCCTSKESRECTPSVWKGDLSRDGEGEIDKKNNNNNDGNSSSSSSTYEISFPIDRNLLSYLGNSTLNDVHSSHHFHSSSSSSPSSFSSTSEEKKEGDMTERREEERERERLFFSYKIDLGNYILPDMDAVVVMRDGIIDPKLSVNLEKFGGVEGAEEEVEGAGFVERGARGSGMFDDEDEDEEKIEERGENGEKEEEKRKIERKDVYNEGRDEREGCCGGGGGETSHCGGSMGPRSSSSSSDGDVSAGCTYTGEREGVQGEEQEGEGDGVLTLKEKEEEEESAYHSSSSCSSSSCGGGRVGEDFSSHHHGEGGGGEEEQEMNGEEEDAYIGSFMNIRHPQVRDVIAKELQFIPEYSNYWRTNTQPFHRGQVSSLSLLPSSSSSS